MALSIDSSSVNNLNNRPSPSSRHSNSHYLTWTPAHERRLLLVQAQLAKAQAEWSEDQEIWLDEVSTSLIPPVEEIGFRQSRLALMVREYLSARLC